jgi:hypothetical protein
MRSTLSERLLDEITLCCMNREGPGGYDQPLRIDLLKDALQAVDKLENMEQIAVLFMKGGAVRGVGK